ncbi:MAG: acyl-CoA synthetase [Alphaproteobacteria bacterium]|nr:acyl-CoA synthetase [Alphaproteobacteria bacterium]
MAKGKSGSKGGRKASTTGSKARAPAGKSAKPPAKKKTAAKRVAAKPPATARKARDRPHAPPHRAGPSKARRPVGRVPATARHRQACAPALSKNIYERNLDQNAANFAPLTPMQFLERSASVYPDRPSIIHGPRRYTWRQTYTRCRQLASALERAGIGLGDTVAIMAPNVPEMYEANFGVPMAGAVINSLNTRLDAAMLAFILDHSETKLLIVDREFHRTMRDALAQAKVKPIVVDIDDPQCDDRAPIGSVTYEDFIAGGDPDYAWSYPASEWDSISLNYTSGTTGDPKGVVFCHRGAALAAYGNATQWAMGMHPRYLWTLPMFHCNGWCFPWTLALVAGTSICLRRINAGAIFDAITEHDVTHMCGAPIILGFIINATDNERRPLQRTVEFMTAAAPPPAAVLEAVEKQGFHITHVYGLTEVYGPATICAWHDEWDGLPSDERARLKARQGVRYTAEDAVAVLDPATLEPVPRDGNTMGEVFFRGNLVMKGYLKNPSATQAAFAGGWFHSGDLGVVHEDGYIELRDRSKDIIISGGENISTIEVEGVLYKHPAVLEAAVVARPDEKWGETPCAFLVLKPGMSATAEEIIAYCRAHMAGYKIPRTVVFRELPKTSTGKVQKFVLRDWAKEL